MSTVAYRKIGARHTSSKPSWSVAESHPRTWIEQELEPLLANLPVTVKEVNHYIGQQHLGGQTEPEAQVVADVVIGRSSRHDDVLGFFLYWIGPERYLAIVPTQIVKRWRYPSIPTNEHRYLAAPDNLVSLIRALHEQYEIDNFKAHKREKVRNLQERAVTEVIRQIANEEQFAFFVSNTPRLIKITVRLDNRNQVKISVPFTEFENILPQLRDVILNLRDMYRHRIHIKTSQILHHMSWIEPAPPAVEAGPEGRHTD